MNIVLIGMPGSGKTTVSRILAEKYGYKIIDTDSEIVARHGDISEIFRFYGEEKFREWETEAVKNAALSANSVISTGGGCVLRPENVAELKKSGKIVYLRARLQTLISRLQGDNSRPLLAGDLAGKLKELYEFRSPVYQMAADVSIDTDGYDPDVTAKTITELIK